MVLSFIFLILILVWVVLRDQYRQEQMTGKESALLKLWRKLKTLAKAGWSAQKPSMKWAIIALIAAILFVILWNYTGIFDWIDPGHHYPNT